MKTTSTITLTINNEKIDFVFNATDSSDFGNLERAVGEYGEYPVSYWLNSEEHFKAYEQFESQF